MYINIFFIFASQRDDMVSNVGKINKFYILENDNMGTNFSKKKY